MFLRNQSSLSSFLKSKWLFCVLITIFRFIIRYWEEYKTFYKNFYSGIREIEDIKNMPREEKYRQQVKVIELHCKKMVFMTLKEKFVNFEPE